MRLINNFLSKKPLLKIVIAATACLLFLAVAFYCNLGDDAGNGSGKYVILASNDLGMHCLQSDYSKFMILPPANTLHVQVFEKEGEEANLVTTGITVEYEVNNNTTSSDKVNFWEYAENYGFTLDPEVGISGNLLSGTCVLSASGKYFEAEYIPVTPYNDKAKPDDPAFPTEYYQTVTITVRETSSQDVLAQTSVVVLPVSDEMKCSTCHGGGKEKDFLTAHDDNESTNLQSAPTACASCHKDNALGAPGNPAYLSLSAAMHGFHADKMDTHPLPDVNPCYSCHPGPVTKCLRGVMFKKGFVCSNCHGSMLADGNPGRDAWVDVPTCGTAGCHDSLHQPNPGIRYRDSYLINGPSEMNGKILCTSCHNSPHAEWPSVRETDNELPKSIYGYADFMRKCSVCHSGSGKLHGNKED